MKMTLLEMVQTILSSMDSDEVNSIGDTVESMQVATVLKTVYTDMIGRANLPENWAFFNLEPSGTITKPTLMTLPDNINDVAWIKYNIETADDTNMIYEQLVALPLDTFLDRMYQINTDEDNTGSFAHTVGSSTVNFFFTDDKAPQFYTSFDDHTIIFDSYDSDVDNTLQSSKSLGYGRKIVPFTMSDTFIPDLDEGQFSLLLNEAKSLAWLELKQSPHGIAERNSKRAWTTLQNKKFALDKPSAFDALPNFGRR